jgi:hypothetical protein
MLRATEAGHLGRLACGIVRPALAVRRALPVLLAAWAALVMLRAVASEARAVAARGEQRPEASWWRLGHPEPERRRRCLTLAGGRVPAGATVEVAAPTDDFFSWRWHAYLMPAHEVVPPTAALLPVAPDEQPSYLVALAPAVPRRGEPVREGDWCGIYRLR